MSLKNITLFFTCIFIVITSGCDRDLEIERHLKDEIEEKDTTIRTLRSRIDELQVEKSDLQARVAELSVEDVNGLAIEEKRKALVEKEAFLKQRETELLERESRVIELEKNIREQGREINTATQQFITNKQDVLESIGEARQMRAGYNDLLEKNDLLRKERIYAENRANNWLIWLSAIALILFFSVFAVVVLYIKHREKVKHIEGALRVIDSGAIPIENKQLIAASLGKSLTHQDIPEND